MKRSVFCIVGLLSLAEQAWAFDPYEFSADELDRIKVEIGSGLPDPDGVKFRDLAAVQKEDGAIVICGWVDAKDSSGNYTGNMPFIGSLEYASAPFMMEQLASTKDDAVRVAARCQNAGAM